MTRRLDREIIREFEDPFVELIKQFSGYCVPFDACEKSESCWTHSWWDHQETGLERLASTAVKMRQNPNWWNIEQFKGDEKRMKAPRVNWSMELRGQGFVYSATCSGELTVPPG